MDRSNKKLIVTYQKNIKVTNENTALPLDAHSKPCSLILKRCSKEVYSILNKNHQTPKRVSKSNQLSIDLNWEKIFCTPVSTRYTTQMVFNAEFCTDFY